MDKTVASTGKIKISNLIDSEHKRRAHHLALYPANSGVDSPWGYVLCSVLRVR